MKRWILAACLVVVGLPAIARGQCETLEAQWLQPSDGVASFGYLGDIEGDLLVVGAKDDGTRVPYGGSAYVFRRDSSGTWIEEQKLYPEDPAVRDHFGFSVATNGNQILVGALGDDDMGENAGVIYVFLHTTGGWSQTQKLFTSDIAAGDAIGTDVSIDGDLAVIGCQGDDDLGSRSGSAYVFRFDGSLWKQEQKLLAHDGGSEDHFGFSTSVHQNSIAVGTLLRGAAYVYRFDGMSWIQEQKLSGPMLEYGWEVSIRGDRLLVGDPADSTQALGAGTAYVYRFDGSQWVEQQRLYAADASEGRHLGFSIDQADSLAVIGSVDIITWMNAGTAYSFRFDRSHWLEEKKLIPHNSYYGDAFGHSVSVSDQTALVCRFGDPWYPGGTAYTYDTTPLALHATPPSAAPGDTLTLASEGGSPGTASAIVLVDLAGTATFVPLAFTLLPASTCSWSFAGTVPPGLSGLTMGFQSFGFSVFGHVLASAPQNVLFL